MAGRSTFGRSRRNSWNSARYKPAFTALPAPPVAAAVAPARWRREVLRPMNRPKVRQVLECASPLALFLLVWVRKSGRGLPQSRTLSRRRTHLRRSWSQRMRKNERGLSMASTSNIVGRYPCLPVGRGLNLSNESLLLFHTIESIACSGCIGISHQRLRPIALNIAARQSDPAPRAQVRRVFHRIVLTRKCAEADCGTLSAQSNGSDPQLDSYRETSTLYTIPTSPGNGHHVTQPGRHICLTVSVFAPPNHRAVALERQTE